MCSTNDLRPATYPNNQFWHKIYLFFLSIFQEEINKVIFVCVYELENSFERFQKVLPNFVCVIKIACALLLFVFPPAVSGISGL